MSFVDVPSEFQEHTMNNNQRLLVMVRDSKVHCHVPSPDGEFLIFSEQHYVIVVSSLSNHWEVLQFSFFFKSSF